VTGFGSVVVQAVVAQVPVPGSLDPPLPVAGGVSLPSACRMSAASSARASSSAAGVLVAWYVLGNTPWAMALACSPAPSFFARLSSS